ncbi:M23 family metallopeptidase [Aequorivita echinoideorum]|uniref:M23 family metallopeptidase n=1 Tax=Aequorivita echinoideorum TaxID=1549647 RepID=A0ABS5S6E1_9FLAO|nr:M23 family metallopeptidase [Aequorivita echinoideorum]MBT0608783.1 M23 family metallopeptidase [Aequorivita echinoideorum]
MTKYILPFLLFATAVQSQSEIPKDYFANPLDIELILAGNFGEMRANHFHSGIDIKTEQREGLPVYAPADGYVSRINVQHYGYGKALYILHPNGYTTVYGHLRSFAGEIEKYVKDTQYAKETFEIELFPDASLLPVKKGDLIAYTGNTGGSGGPHLHYEIRDGAQRPMNPLLFGVSIPDTQIPIVTNLFVYPIDEDSQVNQNQNRQKLRLIKQKDGSYKTESVKAFGKLGFGITTYDQQDGASNKNGSYRIKTVYNGTEKFEVLFNKFSFDETRYLNRYTDYEYYETNKSMIQKLFREKNNPLSIITNEDDNGYIIAEDGRQSVYTIDVSDFSGNKIVITVPIEGKKLEILEPKIRKTSDDFIYSDQATSITKGKFSIYIPANALYEDTYLNIDANGDVLNFHEDIVPIHQNISITADISDYKDVDRDKLYIGRLNYKGVPYYNSTSRNGDKLTGKTRTFGKFTVAADTTPPVIKPVNFSDGKWMSNKNFLEVKITDDLSGISSYRATINGKFILMEYNYKNDVLTYNFNDNVILESENNLKVIVVDNVGNSATFEAKFFRKNS